MLEEIERGPAFLFSQQKDSVVVDNEEDGCLAVVGTARRASDDVEKGRPQLLVASWLLQGAIVCAEARYTGRDDKYSFLKFGQRSRPVLACVTKCTGINRGPPGDASRSALYE